MKTTRLLLVLVISACGTQGELFTEAVQPLPLVATSSAIVQVVPATRRAVVVRPGTTTPTALRLSAGARRAVRVPGAEQLIVLTGTVRAPTLDLVDLGAATVTTLGTSGLFDELTFSEDGAVAVLTYSATSRPAGLTARNLNEVGVLNVVAQTVTRLQLDTASLAPRGVVFAEPEPNRRLVAVLLDRGVAVFDALHPDVAPRRISIRPEGSATETSVVQGLFSRDAHWLFLRATGLDDVVVVELGSEVGTTMSASINFVAGARGLVDLARAPVGFDDSVVALFLGAEVDLLDARGIQDNVKRFALSAQYTHVAPLTGSRVLLYGDAMGSLAAWDVADGRSGVVAVDGTYTGAVVLPSMNKAVLSVAGSSGSGAGPTLSTVTVSGETNRLRLQLQAVQLSKSLGAVTRDPLSGRLFFNVTSSPAIVTMDLSSLQLVEVPLDTPAVKLHFLPDGDWLVAEHTSVYGDVTVVPAGAVERSSALRLQDFAFTQDLDRTGDRP